MATNKAYKKKKIYGDNHSDFYWFVVHSMAKRRTISYESKKKKSLAEFIAKKKVCIKVLLHDGFIIDDYFFRKDFPELGEPAEPIVFTSPIGVVKNAVSGIVDFFKHRKTEE